MHTKNMWYYLGEVKEHFPEKETHARALSLFFFCLHFYWNIVAL